MSQVDVLVPLEAFELERTDILALKRNELVPMLTDPYKLNHYADAIVQAQAVLLDGIDPHLTQQLNQTIEQLIQMLGVSKKYLRPRRFNALQRWLGADLDYSVGQVDYYKKLDQLLQQADALSQKLQIEIQKSQSRYQQLTGLRKQMARSILAAEEFLQEFPQFMTKERSLDHFSERLSKKIYTLRTLQSSNDIAMQQMQLTQRLSFQLLDRFKEAQQVLIPAWQYHVKNSQGQNADQNLDQLDRSREKLIKTLKKSLEKASHG